MKEIQFRMSELRNIHKICVYNYHESGCEAWQKLHQNINGLKISKCPGRCTLVGSVNCPGHIRQSEHANKKKTFSIDNKVYRKLSSAAHLMFKVSEYKTLFVTLTFPKFKKKIDEKTINQCFSRFMENLHNSKKYDVNYYCAVRECGETRGRFHFHLLVSIKFVDFRDINNAWNSAISDVCYYSPCAFRTQSDTVIIRNPAKALRYCCKYFSKQRGSKSFSRIVFISNSLLYHKEPDGVNIATGEILDKKVSNLKKSVCGPVNDLLLNYKGVFIQKTEFTTIFRITDAKHFEQFCNKYLYSLFKLSDKKPDFRGFPG
jgi:hypothetical protein